ncbi:SAM-dependent methyltransferase [Nocardiopsis potens]|uniref:SAM-dependent methyltransferase n=1 Tax=Nocardiopsis potens TaxID=1246458 RepID=UPI00034A5D49|nr:SAM-dependent methyltransferase [Nocardiopsis potens]
MTDEPARPGAPAPAGIDTSVSHVARIWNYWLGGRDNYPVDRQVGDEILRILPEVADLARASRAFLIRAVTHLAREAGARQFLDIGTGLPTANNTHEIAQAAAPESRIVYVDNDPLVLVHANALLTGTAEGATAYIDADLRDPAAILEKAAETLDMSRPVVLLLMGIVEFITDDAEAQAVVEHLTGALPSGSHVVFYDGTAVVHPERSAEVAAAWNATGNAPLVLRSPERMAGFFTGLELLEPGLVPLNRWRPGPVEVGADRDVDAYCAVARVP